jgi:sugar phosphate isomerase/epimerase
LILCSSGAFFHRGERGALFVPDGSHVDAVVTYGCRLPAEGIEVLVTRQMVDDLTAAADTLTRTELRFPVVHGPKRLGAALPGDDAVAQLEKSAWFARQIGASVLVLHLWDLPEGDRRFDERLEALRLALDVVADHDIALAVETIPCLEATPLRNIERVLEHDPRACVALDTEFLALHGEVEAAMSADWLWGDGRVRHIHIKDFADGLVDSEGTRRYRLPGEGTINFGDVFGVLQHRGFTGTVSLEAAAHRPDGSPDLDALSNALARMTHSPWRYSG